MTSLFCRKEKGRLESCEIYLEVVSTQQSSSKPDIPERTPICVRVSCKWRWYSCNWRQERVSNSFSNRRRSWGVSWKGFRCYFELLGRGGELSTRHLESTEIGHKSQRSRQGGPFDLITWWLDLVQKHPKETSLREYLAGAYAKREAESDLHSQIVLRYPTAVMNKLEDHETVSSTLKSFELSETNVLVSAGLDPRFKWWTPIQVIPSQVTEFNYSYWSE